jgi:hypothetical protein
MITLVKASALVATALTAAASVVALRMPAPGGAATGPVVVAPAASQGSGTGPPGHPDRGGGSAGLPGGGSAAGGASTRGAGGSATRLPCRCGRAPWRELPVDPDCAPL